MKLLRSEVVEASASWWGETGSTVVEAAILIPVAMLLVLFAVQACLWTHAATLVQNAAAQGDQIATETGGSEAQGIAQAQSLLASTGSHVVVNPSFAVNRLPGDQLEFRISATTESVIPGLDLHVSAVRIGSIQEFRESG